MKKITTIMAALTICSACQGLVEEIDVTGNEEMLVIAAQLLQDKTSHEVYIFSSSGSTCRSEYGAKVTYSVNGGPETVLSGIEPDYGDVWGDAAQNYAGYSFDYKLVPGDEVTFTAAKNSGRACATLTVPGSACTSCTLDSLSLVEYVDGYAYTNHYYDITVHDKPDGQVHYYLLQMEDVLFRVNPAGQDVDSVFIAHHFDSSNEPLLHPSGMSIMGEAGIEGNVYNQFTSRSFKGASYTLRVKDSSLGYTFEEFTGTFDTGDAFRLERRSKVYTTTYEEYVYLTNISAESHYIIEEFTEAVVFPSNVTGGLGFVAAATPAVGAIKYPAVVFTGVDVATAYAEMGLW